MKTTRMKEIALELGVSLNTVSRALRDCYDISESMKEKVRQKAIEMGYVPNIVYQSIKNTKNKIVAIVISDFKNFYSSCMCEKTMKNLVLQNIDFTILCANGLVMKEDLVKQCISQKVDGIITFVTPSIGSFDLALLNNIKFVYIGSDFVSNNMHQIMCDNRKIAKIAAEYLLNQGELYSYAFIGASSGLSYLRFESFRDTLLEKKPDAIIDLIDWDKDKEALVNRLLSGKKIGYFGYNDEVIYETIELVYRHPKFNYDNAKFIGVDAIANHMSGLVKIPSVDRNYDNICEKAVNIIVNSFEDEKYPINKLKIEIKLFDPNKRKGNVMYEK